MSYNTQAQMAVDSFLQRRIAACAATQEVSPPVQWASENQWAMSGEPGWDGAYAYAINANNPAPGMDEAVITDAMILSAVQKRLGITPAA